MAVRMAGIDRLSGQWQNPGLIVDSGYSGEMDDAGEDASMKRISTSMP